MNIINSLHNRRTIERKIPKVPSATGQMVMFGVDDGLVGAGYGFQTDPLNPQWTTIPSDY